MGDETGGGDGDDGIDPPHSSTSDGDTTTSGGDATGDGDGDDDHGDDDHHDDDDDDGDDDDHGDDDDDQGDVGETGEPSGCWDELWAGDSLPAVIFADTTPLDDDADGSCGASSAPDFQLGFVAPWKGEFVFDTAGSSFDTILTIHDGECGPQELACNDNFLALESRTQLHLDAGELVTVSVDGADAFSVGELQLTISEAVPLSCDWKNITGNLPKILQGDTTGGVDELASGCGGAGAPEALYRFVAPGPGTYRFDTFGSSFDTVLYVMEDCGDAPLACNDDKNFDLQSELVLDLDGGQKLMIAVDGRGPGDFGPFLLHVEKL